VTPRLVAVAALASLAACGREAPGRGFAGADDDAAVRAMVARQRPAIEAWFGAPMPRGFEVVVFPHRATMAAFARTTWNVDELPCWAVAMGSGTKLVVLAPSMWTAEACEHATDTPADVERIIAHELVHVYQGQHRPDDVEMNAVDADAAWFVEGLAVHASGQLDAQRIAQARGVADSTPQFSLDSAWEGPARYAVAGTIVRSIEQKVGRARVRALLPMSTKAELVAALGMTEAQIIATWRIAVATMTPAVGEPASR
jgi:hypothetical protein